MQRHRWLQHTIVGLLLTHGLCAQITIQKTDIAQFWEANTTIKVYSDTSQYLNVGKTGGPNVYDFSSLLFPDSAALTLYSSSQIPQLASRFNPSSLVWGTSPQTIYSSPVYLFTDTSYGELASVYIYPDSQMYSYEMIPVLKFPASFNLQWNRPSGAASQIIDSTYVNNLLTYHSSIIGGPKNYTIDGYGTLILKGQSYQCLRVTEIDPNSTTYYRFSYFTKEGISISFNSDQNKSDTGRVIVNGVHFINATGVATSVSSNAIAPSFFSLSQNYPNPFNPSTHIAFSLPKEEHVVLQIYDVLGRSVETLVDGVLSQGVHNLEWNASHKESGVYFYRLHVNGATSTRKLLYLK